MSGTHWLQLFKGGYSRLNKLTLYTLAVLQCLSSVFLLWIFPMAYLRNKTLVPTSSPATAPFICSPLQQNQTCYRLLLFSNPCQSGFAPYLYIKSVLVVTSDLYKFKANHQFSFVTLFDLAAAFGMIVYPYLLNIFCLLASKTTPNSDFPPASLVTTKYTLLSSSLLNNRVQSFVLFSLVMLILQ